jgi:hypothetical protein
LLLLLLLLNGVNSRLSTQRGRTTAAQGHGLVRAVVGSLQWENLGWFSRHRGRDPRLAAAARLLGGCWPAALLRLLSRQCWKSRQSTAQHFIQQIGFARVRCTPSPFATAPGLESNRPPGCRSLEPQHGTCKTRYERGRERQRWPLLGARSCRWLGHDAMASRPLSLSQPPMCNRESLPVPSCALCFVPSVVSTDLLT